MHKYFSEWYQFAVPEPSSELLAKRWGCVEALVNEKVTASLLLDWVRIAFDSPFPTTKRRVDALNLIRSLCQKIDSTFLGRNNENEVRVLTSAALVKMLENSSAEADLIALGLVCGTSVGHKLINADLLLAGREYLNVESNRVRQLTEIDGGSTEMSPSRIKEDIQKIADEVDAEPESAVSAILKCIGDLDDMFAKLKNTVGDTNKKLRGNQSVLSEENSVLWWFFGQKSYTLDASWDSVSRSTAAIVAANELAALTEFCPGFHASEDYIARVTDWANLHNEGEILVTLSDAINQLPERAKIELSKLPDSIAPEDIYNLCPVIAALRASAQIGENWQPLWRSEMGHGFDLVVEPRELGSITYNELILLKAYGSI